MRWALFCFLAFFAGQAEARPEAHPAHAIAMHSEPLYPAGFRHFSYVNPAAVEGGQLRLAENGSFDSLNPFIIRGQPAQGLREFVYESLMARGYDEAFTLYGLLAESVETDASRKWVSFILRPEARFSDGSPVRPEDVMFSARVLREKGRPNHRFYYSKIARMTKIGARGVRFEFVSGSDREMPLIMGLMPILSQAYFTRQPFTQTSLVPPVGSGPYIVSEAVAGKRLVYQKNPDWWGKDLPVNRGRYNPAQIIYDYYRSESSAFQAFQSGLANLWIEDDPARWTQAYDFPALREGRVARGAFTSRAPSGMWGLVFNTRRGAFADVRVREALGLTLDFAWINKHLFHNAYERTRSFFDRSELSSYNRPASQREEELLAPFAIPPAVMQKGYAAFESAAGERQKRRRAFALLQAAGWRLQNGRLVNEAGEVLRFEILTLTRSEERLALVIANRLKTLGVEVPVASTNASTWQARIREFDFDMFFYRWGMSLSPGNEQHFYWSAAAADEAGSRNYAGVKSPAAEAMINALTEAETRAGLVAAARGLDRVLLAGHYVIPLFHPAGQWVAWDKSVRWPEKTSLYGMALDTLWLEP